MTRILRVLLLAAVVPLLSSPAHAQVDAAPDLAEEEEEEPVLAPEPAEPPGASPLVIAGEKIHRGTRREVTLRLSESFTASQVDIPVVVVRGRQPGPSLCLIGGIHGDELNGMEIVRRVMERQHPEGLAGTIIGVPIVNVFGFATQTRYLPDRRDLNRSFPGSPNGSTAARIAHRLFSEVVHHCTHLIDFHTGSLHRTNLPQIRGDLRDEEVLRLARAFGAPALLHSPGPSNTLRRSAVSAGVAAILYEAGETMRFQQPEVRRGVAGTEAVMRALGMREGETSTAEKTVLYSGSEWVRAERGGLVELAVSPGDFVEAGDLLGTITDPLRKEMGFIRAPRAGTVLGAVVAPMVLPGLAVVNLGIEGLPPGEEDPTRADAD